MIRKCLKLIATAQVFPDATDLFPYPLDRNELAGTAGKKEVDVFMLFSTAENSCGDPHSFDSHSLGR